MKIGWLLVYRGIRSIIFDSFTIDELCLFLLSNHRCKCLKIFVEHTYLSLLGYNIGAIVFENIEKIE